MYKPNKKTQVIDVITAIRELDRFKKGTSEYTKAHKEAVKQVAGYNYFRDNGAHGISISKARHLIQIKNHQENQKNKLSAKKLAIQNNNKSKRNDGTK